MATTGQLGKPNLLWRPGRASGDTTSLGHQMEPTPMAEELGNNEFKFGLAYFDGEELSESQIANVADKWLSQSISYQLQTFNLFVNRLDNKIWDIEFSNDLPPISKNENWLSLNLPCSISAIYPAYTVKDSYVLRLSNMSDKIVDVSDLKEKGYLLTNALEEVIDSKYQIEPYSMATFIKKY